MLPLGREAPPEIDLGSPRVVADASGAVVKTMRYDAWGGVVADGNPSFTLPLGYAGGIADPATGLLRFGFRDYEPATGPWTARDPALFGGGRWILYAYAANDSIGGRHPTGLFCIGFSVYDVVGTGLSLCMTGDGVSVCVSVSAAGSGARSAPI